ncbi:WG repeat-containing protein [uncultured Chryseobacterium sp.]|uniref:WG repeat-containing protein n=1 Tax=uncultured Chryseobacterium sp. TaxID=259322 RepID=UPI0025F3C6FF|nr:WG repeat-containing protein [uncultured Chryseobacterium sp.]
MKKAFIFLFFLVSILSFSQFSVPYRIGNKFGIADGSGKIIIPAEYDHIDVSSSPGVFTATKGSSRENFKTTCIYRNKIVLKDTGYNFFEIEGPFIKGIKISDLDRFYQYNGSLASLSTDIYTITGKKIFDKSYSHITVVEDEKKPALKNEKLFLLLDQSQRYSLVLLNENTLKITRTFFENAEKIDTDYDRFPQSFSITYYGGISGSRKLDLFFENGKIKNYSSDPVQQKSNSYSAYSSSSSYPPPPPPAERSEAQESVKQPPVKEQLKPSIREAYDSKKYTEPFTTDRILFRQQELYQAELRESEGKTGLFNIRDNKWIIPALYDDIIRTDFSCPACTVYILKKGTGYKIMECNPRNSQLFKGNFTMIPYLYHKNYSKEGFHLIKLFDKEGNFFAYANQDGIVYYKK